MLSLQAQKKQRAPAARKAGKLVHSVRVKNWKRIRGKTKEERRELEEKNSQEQFRFQNNRASGKKKRRHKEHQEESERRNTEKQNTVTHTHTMHRQSKGMIALT
jgi:hypothetical protein